jgi:predicted HTH transcriptional regulator
VSAGFKRFYVTLLAPRDFEEMDRDERMTNRSLRERFHQPESKTAIISQIIAAAIEAKVVKADEKVGGSRKYARYLPFWA